MILWGFRKNEQGVIVSRLFDSDNFPAGWYDSPDKIDPPSDVVKLEQREAYVAPAGTFKSMEPAIETPAKGHCPKCGKHIGRGIGFHKKRCEG